MALSHAQTSLEEDHAHHHIVPLKTYYTVFGVLMICTVLTVVAAYVDMGMFNLPVALGIASFKATIVALYFMHVKYSGNLVRLSIAAGVMFFILLMIGIMTDYWTRGAAVSLAQGFPIG